jgi:hypothetical protein
MALSRRWIAHLLKEKGWAFALKGQLADFADAVVSGLGVIFGFFEYKVLGKEY